MKERKALSAYRHELKRMLPRSVKAIKGYVKHKGSQMKAVKDANLKMLKVCFGPCRCFSAAKR